jgi:hypothetical protein
MAERILKDVPEERLQQVIKSFEREGCTTQVVKQANGLYTVIANCKA